MVSWESSRTKNVGLWWARFFLIELDKIKKKGRFISNTLIKNMTQKNYSFLAGAIFLLVALLHLSRMIFSWSALIAGWAVPIWINWIGFAGAGFLAWQGLKLGRKQ